MQFQDGLKVTKRWSACASGCFLVAYVFHINSLLTFKDLDANLSRHSDEGEEFVLLEVSVEKGWAVHWAGLPLFCGEKGCISFTGCSHPFMKNVQFIHRLLAHGLAFTIGQ